MRLQRLERAERVPEPVVDIEGPAVGVYFVVESAVVLAVLSDLDHALGTAVERGVEDFALCFCAPFNLDLSERLIPASLCGRP